MQSVAFFGVLLITVFPVLARLWFDFLTRGNGWRQGDWLINSGAGPVRRGIIGDALIWLSDASSIPLLTLTIAVQIGMFVLLVGLFILVWRAHEHRLLILFLVASPAFFMIQWAGEVQGIMRKEIFGYLAMASLLLTGLSRPHRTVLVLPAMVFFAIGCFGNIINAMTVVPFCIALYLLHDQGRFSKRALIGLVGVALVSSIGAIGFALRFQDVPMLAGMCDPLVARGFEATFCDDAIRWIVDDDVDHLAQVAVRMTVTNIAQFLIVAIIALVPIALAFRVFTETRTLSWYLLVTFVPMLPFYALATDWGRWLSIPYSFWVLLVLLAHASGKLTMVKAPSAVAVYAMLCVSLLLSHDVSIGWDVGGTISSFVRTISDFL